MYAKYAQLRDAKGLTDAMVSASTGISQDAFSKWKKRSETNPWACLAFDSMLKVCEVLDVDILTFERKEDK